VHSAAHRHALAKSDREHHCGLNRIFALCMWKMVQVTLGWGRGGHKLHAHEAIGEEVGFAALSYSRKASELVGEKIEFS
jgi:hypothetical protein